MSVSQPRPNLFLIGSMKSGTTQLSELLADHPEIFMSSPKEPCYFVDGKALKRVWPYRWEQGYWRSEERYLELFANAGAARVIAEASMVYTHAPICSGVPKRILEFIPEARFIYVMRDPIERTISHYWHRVRWWREHRPMLEALRKDPQYTDVSHYAMQLREYLRYVDAARIHVLTHEALLADPAHELSRIFAWLGVNPSFRPARILAPVNERPEVIGQVRGLGLLDRLRSNGAYARIARYVPRPLRTLGNRLAVRGVRPEEVPTAEAERYLRSRQQRETLDLSALLHRDFSEWTTLYEGSAPRRTDAPAGAETAETAAAARSTAG